MLHVQSSTYDVPEEKTDRTITKRRLWSKTLEDMCDEELMLPKATVVKAIKERVPSDMRVGSETSDMVLECCNSLIHILSSTANEVSEKQKRTTILPEDVLQAVEDLGFTSYAPALKAALDAYKSEKKEAKSLKSKKAATMSGMSQEELIEMQQKLFQQAREKQQQHAPHTVD